MDILAIDIGFGFTKATDGKRSVIFKSVLGEATDLQFQGSILDATTDEHIQLDVDGRSLFIGDLAERQSNTRFFTLDQAQFISRFAKYLALAAAARLVNGFVPVNLVTGLPIGYYKQYKEELATLLTGEHRIFLTDANGKREERSIKINRVKIIPQPFGSLFNLMLNDLGEVGDKRLVKEKIGIADIGFRTSDYTVSDKMRYSERGSRTTDSGIASAFNILANKLREKSGVNVELYRLHEAVDRGSIRIRGKEYDLKILTDQIFGQLASTIANEIDRLWADDWDMDTIILTGGGGVVLAKYLQPLINGQVLVVDAANDARLCNVRGYWKFGKHLWSKGVIPTPAGMPGGKS